MSCDCADSHAEAHAGVSRRNFLAGALGLTAAVGASSLLPRYAFAASGPAYTGDTLVVLSLRGGADWLSLVAPLGDPDYAPARPTTAIPTSSAGRLDGYFGLHPAMAPLLPLFSAGQLAFVHAVGNPDPTRSHFDAIRLQELAGATGTGWLSRATATTGATGALAAMHLGGADVPLSQTGAAPATAMTSLASFALNDPAQGHDVAMRTLRTLYGGSKNATGNAARDVIDSLGVVPAAAHQLPTVAYPKTPTAVALEDVARMVRSGLGLQVATVDVGGWDMHSALGAAGGGQMAKRAGELAGALAAFASDLGPLLGRVTVVTLTEFGRRVAENGNAGFDHGHGYCMAVLGGAVNGGKVITNWPTLAPAALNQGDLAATTDYRQVLGEILSVRCQINPATVFPGLPPGVLGVVRA
jgi:uncharacterized protein (DUF1501 family)